MKYFSQFVFFVLALYLFALGNVEKALTGTKNLNSANSAVNSNSVDWVYNRMQRNLPYNETKKYLKNVKERIKIYEGWL